MAAVAKRSHMENVPVHTLKLLGNSCLTHSYSLMSKAILNPAPKAII